MSNITPPQSKFLNALRANLENDYPGDIQEDQVEKVMQLLTESLKEKKENQLALINSFNKNHPLEDVVNFLRKS